MQAVASRIEQGSGRLIPGTPAGSSKERAHLRGQQGFTLIELLAVIAIIGILASVVAGATGGLGAVGQGAQIVSDTKTIETAADRFFNDAFPQVYPVLPLERDASGQINDPLVADAGDLFVRLLDFEARLPQDPTTTFTPDFVKDIPNSAALVSYRIDTDLGSVFAAADGAQLVKQAKTRLDVKTGNKGPDSPSLGDSSPIAASDYSFILRMKKNEAAVEILSVEIPAGYSLGGGSQPAGTLMGKLFITFSTDNPWDAGQTVTLNADVVKTGEANAWKILVRYDTNLSTGADNDVNVKNDPDPQPADDRTHTLNLIPPTEDTPGKITLVMDRTTEDAGGDYVDPAHNEATETWTLVVFAHPKTSDEQEIGGVNTFTNPALTKVYRWFTEEHTTINVDKVFKRVSGLQAIVIKGVSTPSVLLTSISVTPVSPSVTVGSTQQFTARGTFSDNSIAVLTSGLTWTSDNPAVATIDNSGLAITLATGTTLISVRENGTPSTPVTLTVTGPAVTSVSPANGDVAVAVNTNITVTFSEPVDATSAQNNFTVSDGAGDIAGGVLLTIDGLSATFSPNADLDTDTTYTVTLTSGVITSPIGDAFVPFSSSFTTAP